MISSHVSRNRSRNRSSACRFILSAAALSASTGVALAGIVGGGGATHTWTGHFSTAWNTNGNWNTNAVPAAGDSAIVNSGPNQAWLGSNTPALRSLYVGGAKTVSNNGFSLNVTNTLASTTINGVDSTLFLNPSASPFELQTGTLTVENNGRLQLADGWALATSQVTLSTGGRITGRGYLDITSNAPAAFNGANGSLISASGGPLHIRVFNGGSLVMPPTINATTADSFVSLSGPLMLPINDINLGPSAGFGSANNWTLAGELNAASGAGEESLVYGSGAASITGDILVTANSRLVFDSNVNFDPTANVTVNAGATLEVNELFSSDAGHTTTLWQNSHLTLNAAHTAAGWDGDIESFAGSIESNGPIGLRIDGSITLGSFGGLRTIIAGTSPVTLTGTASAPGLGAIVNGTFDLAAGSTLTTGPSATIFVNGDMIARTDATLSGAGVVNVQSGGELTVQSDANMGLDVINAGDVRIGTFSNQNLAEINGTFTQAAAGRLLIDISGAGDSQRDFLQVWDDVALNGTLHVSLVGGYTPNLGDQFQVLAANIVSGTFSGLTGAPGFSVSYDNDSVTLTYDGVWPLGDLNHDGLVNVTDLLMVISAWGAAGPNAADANGDGIVNVTDLLIVIGNWM